MATLATYTGHPLLDVGLATLVVFAGKQRPEELTDADLEAAADYMAANYPRPPLRGYLTTVFPNADGFTQPAYFNDPAKQARYADLVLRSFRDAVPTLDERDPFLDRPVPNVSYNVKDELPAGRAYRQHIPMQMGVGVINFYAEGDAGLLVSGAALLAFQALPLGCAKCGGRPLAVHSDNPAILRHFAGRFLEDNRRAIALQQAAGGDKMPEADRSYRTLLIETLLAAREMQARSAARETPFSVTAYHFSNSGQGASLDLYHLPGQVILYLRAMLTADYAQAWGRLVGAAWERPKLKRGQPPTDFRPRRNWLYEDLFQVANDPQRYAPRFIRTYFLRRAYRYERQDETDPRGEYSVRRQIDLISWKLTAPFLRSILNMQPKQIEYIERLGDSLAKYIFEENDRKFYRAFFAAQKFNHLHAAMLRVSRHQVDKGKEPLFTMHQFLSVFDVGEANHPLQWQLKRDIVLIRMLEWLHKNNWVLQQSESDDDLEMEDEVGSGDGEELTNDSEEI